VEAAPGSDARPPRPRSRIGTGPLAESPDGRRPSAAAEDHRPRRGLPGRAAAFPGTAPVV